MRAADWPQRLGDYVESRRSTPFEYGTHDCCRFAAGAVIAMTGHNYMAAFDYKNGLGAERLIRRAGTLDALVNRTLGEPVHPSQAGRGDVVLADLERGSTLGVCLGETCVFAAEPAGLAFHPRAVIRLAWRTE